MVDQRPLEKRLDGIEDWFGSGLDEFGGFTVERVWNGVIVRPLAGGAIGSHETLCFQDQSQFADWFQGWFAKSSKGATV